MNNKLLQKLIEIHIEDYIKIYQDNNLSLEIFEKKIKDNYFLIIKITPLDCSDSKAINKNRIILNILKYDGIHIPESKINKLLIKNLKKCKKGKISNDFTEKIYLQLKFPNIYRKYYKFDNTIIILIVITAILIFGVIWSSYHNIITDYMLTH